MNVRRSTPMAVHPQVHRQESPDREARLSETISWEYRIRLINNPFIWYDLLRVLFIAAVVMQLMVLLMSYLAAGELLFLPLELWGILIGVVVLLFLLAALIYRNVIPARFTLDRRGATYEGIVDMDGYQRTVVWIFRLIGLVARGPMALRFQPYGGSAYAAWRDMRRATGIRRLHVVTLHNSWRPVLRLYCEPEHYDTILALARERVAAAAPRHPAPRPRVARSKVAIALGSVVLTALDLVLSLAWPWYEWDVAPRVLLLAGILILAAGAIWAWWGRLVALVALVAASCYLILFVAEAAQPLPDGSSTVFALHSPQSWPALLGALGLVALGTYHLVRAR
jgi:hypothetical protein